MKIGIFKFKKNEKTQDPVCLMKVKIGDGAIVLDYKDETYYFCSENCKEQFKQKPEGYLS